jgi:predicted ATPase
VTGASSTVGLRHIQIRGFRSARQVAFSPRNLCALVGEAQAGKSTLLAAIRAVLDPEAAPLAAGDVTAGETHLTIRAELASGATVTLEGPPPEGIATANGTAPPVLFLPATERAGQVMAPTGTGPPLTGAMAIFREVLAGRTVGEGDSSTTSPALGLVEAVERCCEARSGGLILLIEEPEMYLRPQAQRYLYRLLRELTLHGNQVIYSTHSPAFLNVARLDELTFVSRGPGDGTTVLQPEPVPAEDEFRLLSEFDAERSEVFLAQAAVLVEGSTEKYALPFVFQALGYDVNRSGITIVECGGKAGIPLIARICNTVGIPFVVVHDRDAPRGAQPNPAERQLNSLIAQVAGKHRTVVLVPDFEAVAGIRGHTHKPERAWQRFTSLAPEAMPRQLTRAAELAVALAQGGLDLSRQTTNPA